MRTKLLLIFYTPLVVILLIGGLLASGLLDSNRDVDAVRLRFDNPIDVSPIEVSDGDSELTATKITHNQDLDPYTGEAYVISFLFKQELAPRYNRRQKLVSKYNKDKSPYAGWAIALKHLPSSNRFEVYLKDSENNGGWFTFDNVPIVNERTYAVTFVLESGTFISGYLYELEDIENNVSKSRLHKMGGLSLNGLGDISSEAHLLITSGRPKVGPFVGAVSELTILRLPNIPEEKNFLKQISGGPRTLLETLSDHCIVSFSPKATSCKASDITQ